MMLHCFVSCLFDGRRTESITINLWDEGSYLLNCVFSLFALFKNERWRLTEAAPTLHDVVCCCSYCQRCSVYLLLF